METYGVILGGAVAMALVAIVALGASNAWRFGRVFGPTTRIGNGGPYREREERSVEGRGVPKTVWLAAVSAGLWGVVTLLVFVPAGALLALAIFFGGEYTGHPFDAWAVAGSLTLAGMCISALLLAVVLCIYAARLMRRDASHVTEVVMWSIAHHLAVFVYFLIFGAMVGQWEGVFIACVAAVGPCLAGGLQALAMSAAADQIQDIEAEEDRGLALGAKAPLVA